MFNKLTIAIVLLSVLSCTPKNGGAPANDPAIYPAAPPCADQMRSQFTTIRERQTRWYAERGSPVPREENSSQLTIGHSGRAVMIVHGFISSPQAMAEVAGEMKKAGHTVYVPLLTGFGSDARAANEAGPDDWRESVEAGAALLKICYPEIIVVAHSLGGALVVDEIENRDFKNVAGLVFLSPFLKLEHPWPALLAEALSGGMDDIDVASLQTATGIDPYSYLPLSRPKPGEAAPFLPLKALAKVIGLQQTFRNFPTRKVAIPVFLTASEADQVIDTEFSARYLSAEFPTFSQWIYPRSEKIGHSVESRELNPHFDELSVLVRDFVLSH